MADKKKKPAPKKKTAAKKSTKQEKQSLIDRSEMIRWLLGFLAIFIIISFIPTVNSGVVGGKISEWLRGLFGPIYYVIPLLILVMVFTWGKDKKNNNVKARGFLFFLEFVFISILVHAIVADDNVSFDGLYDRGVEMTSAGIISGSIALAFTATIGKLPSIIFAVLGIFVCTVFLFGVSPKDMIMAFINYIRDLFANMKSDEDEDEDEEEDEEEEAPPVKKEKQKKETKKKKEPEKKKEKKKDDDIDLILPDDPEDIYNEPVEILDNAEDEIAEPIPEEDIFGDNAEEDLPEDPAAEKVAEEVTDNSNEMAAEEDDEELYLEPIEDTPYVFPPISLLTANDHGATRPSAGDIERTSRHLEEVLASFNVKAKVIDCTYGPTVTRYELRPEAGVKVKSIVNLADDLALHLAATAIRIENIPGKAAVGIEIPNKNVSMVRLRGLIDNPIFKDAKSRLFAALGEDVAGNPVYLDIAKMPHLLIAGATGQGKSVCINSLILSLLYRNHPNDVKLILIDPKTVEFSDFKDIPHLLVPVINDAKNAAGTLNWACTEMEKRYQLIKEVGARDLAGYNTAVSDDPERETLPQIVIFIDEFADLMMTAPDDVETSVCRLAQKARAAGMHLVIGTQRPSVDVITGLIKANIPSRIALTTVAAVDSRTILDQTGAEKLLGKGDMLYYPVGAMKPQRVQGAFVDGKTEVAAVTQFIKEAAQAQYDEAIMSLIEQEAKLCGLKGKKAAAAAEAEPDDGNEKLDPMFIDAVGVAVECGTVSTSLLQRRLSLGYSRAARIIDKMERKGYIGEFDAATKKRAIIITPEQYAELRLNGEDKAE